MQNHSTVKGDQQTKQVVVSTLCAVAFGFSLTVCVLSIRGGAIPEELDRLSIFILGAIAGLLGKTSVDRLAPDGTVGDPISTVTTEPATDAESEAGG